LQHNPKAKQLGSKGEGKAQWLSKGKATKGNQKTKVENITAKATASGGKGRRQGTGNNEEDTTKKQTKNEADERLPAVPGQQPAAGSRQQAASSKQQAASS
jgi:hypothetical protein